ncbi:MAG: aldehyde dehydrogenase family protein [Actinomycetota bacterium]|nr:aldehyde dehydrogenase family protein [Actinomycetota bacterium]
MPFDYAPAPESRSIVDVESNYGLFIGGSFSEPTSGEFFKTINPATEEVLSEVAEAGQADVDAAVAAARRAYDKTWSKMSGKDRAKSSAKAGGKASSKNASPGGKQGRSNKVRIADV